MKKTALLCGAMMFCALSAHAQSVVYQFQSNARLYADQLNAMQQGLVARQNGSSDSQTLTGASVGATKIIQSGKSLPFQNSTGTQVGVMDSVGNFDISGYLSTLYEVVPDYLKGSGNDGTDDATWIQKAVTNVCAAGGGTVRFLPRHYVIDSQISIGCLVILRGAGWFEAYASSPLASATGTWFDIGETTTAPVYVHDVQSRGTQIRDIAFWQPGQTVPASGATSWTPTTYAPVIYIYNVEGYTRLENLFMDGVYAGVSSVDGGRTIIDGLYGQFFDYAVNLDGDEDVSRINNIHAWPYWSSASQVMAYQEANTKTIELGRADSPFLDNIFTLPSSSGIYFYSGTNATRTGVATGVQIGKLSCDSTVHCLEVAAPNVVVTVNSLRTFGQAGLSTGVPASTASAMQVDAGGSVSAYLGQVEARLLDNAAFTFNATYGQEAGCSYVSVASLAEDFSKSTQGNIFTSLGNGSCSSLSTAYNQVVLGTPPSIVQSSTVTQTLAHSGGTQTETFWATPTKQ